MIHRRRAPFRCGMRAGPGPVPWPGATEGRRGSLMDAGLLHPSEAGGTGHGCPCVFHKTGSLQMQGWSRCVCGISAPSEAPMPSCRSGGRWFCRFLPHCSDAWRFRDAQGGSEEREHKSCPASGGCSFFVCRIAGALDWHLPRGHVGDQNAAAHASGTSTRRRCGPSSPTGMRSAAMRSAGMRSGCENGGLKGPAGAVDGLAGRVAGAGPAPFGKRRCGDASLAMTVLRRGQRFVAGRRKRDRAGW